MRQPCSCKVASTPRQEIIQKMKKMKMVAFFDPQWKRKPRSHLEGQRVLVCHLVRLQGLDVKKRRWRGVVSSMYRWLWLHYVALESIGFDPILETAWRRSKDVLRACVPARSHSAEIVRRFMRRYRARRRLLSRCIFGLGLPPDLSGVILSYVHDTATRGTL